MKNFFNKFDGWLHGLYMACIAFPLYNVGAKYAIDNYNAHPLVFLCFGSLFSSWFLLMYAGRGTLALSSLKTIDTWLFAFLNLAAVSFGVSLLVYVSALQGSVLIRFASIVCFIIALIMGQSSNKKEYLYTFIAFLGVSIMFLNIEISNKEKAISLILLLGASSCQALRQLLSEFHKTNILANTKKDNARVAGVVSSISALIFTLVLLFFSIYQSFFDVIIFTSIPKISDFFNYGTILCASTFAGVFSAGAKYCEFYATKKISAKYLASMLALMPLFVLIYESLLYIIIDKPMPFTAIDIASMSLIIIGNLGISISAIIESKNNNETELRSKYILSSKENVEYCSELMASTMNFTNNDIKITSSLLGVSEKVTIDLLTLEDGEHFNLSQNYFNIITKNYYLNVSSKDSLTGIINRGYLEKEIAELIYKNKKFSLCFIDLDRFKVINDTLGHDAGDEALKYVAKAMGKVNSKGLNARIGGDEFVMLVFNNTDNTISEFNMLLKASIEFNNHTINVSASVGVANCDGSECDLDSLIKQADSNMYQNKKSS